METSLLVVFVTIYKLRRVWQFTAALAALAAIVTTTHMIYADTLLIQAQRTEGVFKTRGSVAFFGFCLMCAANILLAFIGSAVYEAGRPGLAKADREEEAPALGAGEGPDGGAAGRNGRHVAAAPLAAV